MNMMLFEAIYVESFSLRSTESSSLSALYILCWGNYSSLYYILLWILCRFHNYGFVNVEAQQGLKISNSYKLYMQHINFMLHTGMLNYIVPFKISK